MPFAHSFLPLVKSTRFWTEYLFLTDTPYPSPYKEAFQHAGDGSDDGESNSHDENSIQGSDRDINDQDPDNQPSSGQDSTPENEPNTDNHTSSSSSSTSSHRPHSPLLSHTLIFPFNCNRDSTDETFNLSISLDPNLSYIPLTFSAAPDTHDVTIAHDDQAHWHPFVLRWDELEVICKAIGVTHTGRNNDEDLYSHPGLPLLFLYRFAPICQGDDVDRIVGMLAKAWRRVLGEGVNDGDVQRFVERVDCRKRRFRWFKESESENWWIGQGEDAETASGVYTYRSREAVSSGKWLNHEWNDLVEEARAVVQGVGDQDEHEDEYRELGKRFAPRPRHGLNAWLPLREKDRLMHPRAGRYLYLTLDGVLRILGMGRASSSGGSSTSDHISVTVYDDLARGRAIIKQMLWWLVAPLATTLRDGSTYDELPFNLADDNEDRTKEVYLGICVPDILPDCSWLVGHTLPDSLVTQVESREVLGDTDSLSGPANDGWFRLTTADGGEFGFNFSRFDDEKLEGTGAIALRRVTPQTSSILHRLMETSGAVLTPVGLAAKPLNQKIAEISWPPHYVVDARTLHEILSSGAFDLWKKAERNPDVDGSDSGEDTC